MTKKQAEAVIPTPFGNFNLIAFATDAGDTTPHLALVSQTPPKYLPPLIRIHSECLTGDIFKSKRCDCGEQLEAAMRIIGQQGGALVYLRQEGRGIGLINKLKAYCLQDEGWDTADANTHLGLPEDARNYKIAAEMLRQMGYTKVRVLTNNPLKINALADEGIEIEARIPIIIPPREENAFYLETKKLKMGHLI